MNDGSGDSLSDRVIQAVGIIAAIAIVIFAVFALATAAFAHDWYPTECCHNLDCKPIACDDLREEAEGAVSYSPRTDAYPPKPAATFTFERKKVRPSHDERCHVCIHYGSPLCVFVQQGS